MKKMIYGLLFLALVVVPVFLFSGANPAGTTPDIPQQEKPALPSKTNNAHIQSTDMDAANSLICAEVVWADASGGGGWMSALRILDHTGGTYVRCYYFYGAARVGPVHLWASTMKGQAVEFLNILSTISNISGTNLFGTSGTLTLHTHDDSYLISAEIETMNVSLSGIYGKTFPAIQRTNANSANIGRRMVLKGLSNNSLWRTAVGVWNGADGGYTMTVDFSLGTEVGLWIGGFTKVIDPWNTMAFNPFVEAGVSSAIIFPSQGLRSRNTPSLRTDIPAEVPCSVVRRDHGRLPDGTWSRWE